MAKKSKPSAVAGKASSVDLAEVERLLEFMQKHGLEQFEYDREGVHILLKKAATQTPIEPPAVSAQTPGFVPSTAESLAAPAPASQAPAASQAADKVRADDLHVVKSPIVGTFYSAPSPEAERFVTVGARVAAGQVLCIIEAMKLMNEIESDVAGEVVKVFPENGSPVEYGESLFGIRADRKK
jgi:acetyl-CoA carboxylase biotin carboxyl carrier protein